MKTMSLARFCNLDSEDGQDGKQEQTRQGRGNKMEEKAAENVKKKKRQVVLQKSLGAKENMMKRI